MINNIPSEQANLLSTIKGLYETTSTKPTIVEENKVIVDDKTLELKKKQQFYDDVAYIRNVLENIKEEMAKPSKQDSPWG
jgi:protoheme ferro-lyase